MDPNNHALRSPGKRRREVRAKDKAICGCNESIFATMMMNVDQSLIGLNIQNPSLGTLN